jgi:flagellar basal-body rod protein FlgG
VALDGRGFLVADAPAGRLYTRNGNLRLSPGGQLQTLEGYAIQGQDGKPIVLDSSKPVDIGPDGAIRQDGEEIARLAVVDFKDPGALAKRGSAYFLADRATLAPSQAQVLQNRLEAANSQPAESAVRLVNVLRQFESLQKALAIGAEMNRRAVEDVAKVTT